MTSPEPQIRPRELLVPLLIISAILAVSLVLPGFGVVVGMLSPAPLIVINLQRGNRFGLAAAVIVFAVLAPVLGGKQALVFFAEYGILSLLLAEGIRHRLSMEKCVMLGGFGSGLLLLAVLLVLFLESDASIVDFFRTQVQEMMAQSLERLKTTGRDASEIEMMKGMMDRSASLIAFSFPAVMLVGSLFGALVNYAFVRLLWNRLYRDTETVFSDFTAWVLPDALIWAFIASAVAMFLSGEAILAPAANVLIVTLALYFIQGLAVVFHFLESRRVPPALWGLVLLFIMVQPLLMGVMMGFGLFDMWVDFRKIKPASPEETPPEE